MQNYRMGKHAITFKAWLEDRLDSKSEVEKIWEAGRINKGFWVVQITFKTSFDQQKLLYYVNLETGKIKGADDGFSQATLQEGRGIRREKLVGHPLLSVDLP